MKNEVVKKSACDELVKKVNAINTTALVKRTVYGKKITEIEREITSITGLATTAAVNAVGNKIPSASVLFNKTKYDAKVSGIESKYFIPILL